MVPLFSAGVQAERRPPLATCAVGMAVGWCTNAAAPHPSCGARAVVTTRAEPAGGVSPTEPPLGPLVPSAATGGLHGGRAPGRGRPRPRDTPLAPLQEPERLSTPRPQEPGPRASGLLRVHGRLDTRLAEPDPPAAPGVVPCGGRRLRAAPCAGAPRGPSAHGVARSQGRDRPPAGRAHAGQGWARPVWVLPGGPGRWAGGRGPEQAPGRSRGAGRGGAAERHSLRWPARHCANASSVSGPSGKSERRVGAFRCITTVPRLLG